ncbi:MAG: LuxR C-terminal-related transcriptional regulator [Actinomycetota bacterium]
MAEGSSVMSSPATSPSVLMTPEPSALAGARILVVEPEPDRALACGSALAQHGAEPTVVRTLAAARRALDAGRIFDGALVDLGCDAPGVSRLLTRLRLASTPALGVVLAPVMEAGDRQELLLRGAFEVVYRPVLRSSLVEMAQRVVRGTTQLRSNVCREPRTPPHASMLESPARRARFEIRGAVSAMTERDRLTPRESGVLGYIAQGYRYAEIASELSITERTVKMHSANIRRKVGARDRYDLLRMLLEKQA